MPAADRQIGGRRRFLGPRAARWPPAFRTENPSVLLRSASPGAQVVGIGRSLGNSAFSGSRLPSIACEISPSSKATAGTALAKYSAIAVGQTPRFLLPDRRPGARVRFTLSSPGRFPFLTMGCANLPPSALESAALRGPFVWFLSRPVPVKLGKTVAAGRPFSPFPERRVAAAGVSRPS